MPAQRLWFDVSLFDDARQQRSVRWGAPLVVLERAGSTNDLALDAERDGAPEGATFVVREQTHGRGRRGNAWWAPPGDNLTCSVLLRPELDAKETAALPLVVGLAVREVVARRLESQGAVLSAPPVLVKWPNDVLVGSRKIAGVLVESRLRLQAVSAAIVGIGLNVRTRVFPEELAGQATSLARELRPRRTSRSGTSQPTEEPPPFEELLAELLASLERRYERFRSGGFSSFLAELEICDALRGRPVRVDGLLGTAAGIGADGALRLVDDTGIEHRVHSGHVELR